MSKQTCIHVQIYGAGNR